MKATKLTTASLIVAFLVTTVWTQDSYWDNYNQKLKYNYTYNYMVHRSKIRHIDKVVQGKRRKMYFPTLDFKLGWNPLPSQKEVERRVKLFRSLPMYFRKAPFNLGEDYKLAKKWSVVNLYAGRQGSETSWRYPVISWFDRPPDGLANSLYMFEYISQDGKYKWIASPDWSLAHPEKYPEKYRVWAAKKKPTKIGYLGMIDDDLMYDWRNENVEVSRGNFGRNGSLQYAERGNLISPNKSGVFIYVYEQDTFRNRSIDWKLHDRLAYGHKDSLKEDLDSPSERHYLGRKWENRARLEYGPIESDINSPSLRALRVRIFTRTYLAKLRLAKLCVAAPRWSGDYSDAYGRYFGRDIRFNRVDVFKIIKKYSDINRYPDYKKARAGLYEEVYNTVPVHDYWYWVQNRIYPPDEVYKEYEKWLSGKGSLQEVKTKNRVYNLTEDARSMYWMFAVKNPNLETRKRHHQMYYNPNYLSIAVWSGSTGYGPLKHSSSVSMKTIFPYFEGRTIPGRMGVFQNGKAADMNTGGLLHGGFAKKQALSRLLRQYKTMARVWQAAEKGPFMVVSDRTYKRYGHRYFEKLAGHPLAYANVTGAMIDSSARVMLDPDPEYVKQLMDMDYFYVKEKDPCTRKGSKLICEAPDPGNSVESQKKSGNLSMLPLKNISISSSSISWAKRFLRKYPSTKMEIYDDKPLDHGKVKLEEAFDTYSRGILVTDGIYISADQLMDISKQVHRAYKKDTEKYPDMCMLRSHYIPYKDIVRRGYFFIRKMQAKRGLIDKYRGNVKAFMKDVLMKEFPFFVGNPSLFMAIYRNLHIYSQIEYGENFADKGGINHDEDGVVMYSQSVGEFQGPEVTLRRCIDITDRRNDTWFDSYLYAIQHSTGGTDEIIRVANRGRLRKRLATGMNFPQFDTMLQFYNNRKFYRFTADSERYIEMTNPNGRRTLLRDIGMSTNEWGPVGKTRPESMHGLFPGMFRYIPVHTIMKYQLFYQEYHPNQRRNEFTFQNDILTPIVPGNYEPKIMTVMRMSQESGNLQGHKGMDDPTSGAMASMLKNMAYFPTDNLEFVVALGLPTSVVSKKDTRIDIWTRANELLYENVEVVE